MIPNDVQRVLANYCNANVDSDKARRARDEAQTAMERAEKAKTLARQQLANIGGIGPAITERYYRLAGLVYRITHNPDGLPNVQIIEPTE